MIKEIVKYALVLCLMVFSIGSFAQDTIDNSKLEGHVLFVPSGITINVLLSNEINSQSAVVGQTINAILLEDFLYNNQLIAPNGSVIGGTIVSNKKAGYGNRNAQTKVRFTTIRTPYNNIIPINATIFTNDLSGVLKGASAKDSIKDYAKSTAVGAATGALAGTTVGAISDKPIGKSALYGVAVGAGVGAIKGVCEKGESVLIPANSQIAIYFEQPITLNAE